MIAALVGNDHSTLPVTVDTAYSLPSPQPTYSTPLIDSTGDDDDVSGNTVVNLVMN